MKSQYYSAVTTEVKLGAELKVIIFVCDGRS